MQFRSLILLGFGASLAMNISALAAPPAAMPQVPGTAEIMQVASKAEQNTKKKTTTRKASSKSMTPAEKKAAEAMAAKQKAQKEKLARAKAKKEKQAKAKAEREKKLAVQKAEKAKKAEEAKAKRAKMKAEKAKAAQERKARLAKEAEQRNAAREKAAQERRAAREKAAETRRQQMEAKAKAAEDMRVARVRAEEERAARVAAEAQAARAAEIARLSSMDVVKSGNNGELRSEAAARPAPKQTGLLSGLFGGQQATRPTMLPETRALDAAMEQRSSTRPFKVRPEFEPKVVDFGGYNRGTIVIDTAARYLYFVESSSKARRYAIAVGKEGLQYKGSVKVGDKQEWPRWIPTKDMQKREPKKYGQYANGMPGGGANPLGARAIYLHQNGRDTYLRIHGTTAPETIGTNSSNGCFRMINEHVIELYNRVPVGADVVVL